MIYTFSEGHLPEARELSDPATRPPIQAGEGWAAPTPTLSNGDKL